MAEIVNLNRARKRKDRNAARKQGDENAAKFGRTNAERDLTAAQAEKEKRDLDGAKRE